MTVSMKAAARSLLLAGPHRGDRIGVDGLRGLGEGDRLHLVPGGLDVRDVDQPGVGLPRDDLAQDVGHGRFLADRLSAWCRFPVRGPSWPRRTGPAPRKSPSWPPAWRDPRRWRWRRGFPGARRWSARCWRSPGVILPPGPRCRASPWFLASAEAKTSAGAPWLIWVARSEDPAKLSVTVVPGCVASNSSASAVKGALRDAAAKTVRSCRRPRPVRRSPPGRRQRPLPPARRRP